MKACNKQLTILSAAEKSALYEQPDFDDDQHLIFFNLTPNEEALMRSQSDLSAKIHCALQLGYFKAKHFFFRVTWEEAKEDITFIMQQYY